MNQFMHEQGRQDAPRRSFHVLAQVPPPSAVTVESNPAPPHDAAELSDETVAQLATILVLCRGLAGASSGKIAAQLTGTWITLVQSESAIPEAGQARPTPSNSSTPTPTGRHVVRLPGMPTLALILATLEPVSPSTDRLLRRTLALAVPVLRDGESQQRDAESRRRVLDVQAELAHELRTPLTAISGFAQLLRRPGQLDEARRRSYAGIAVTESQQATAIIDHLVAKLQAEAEVLDHREAPQDDGPKAG